MEHLVRLTAAGQELVAAHLEELRRKAPRQAAYLAYLKVAHKPVPRLQLLRQTGGSLKSLAGLIEKGLVEVVERTVLRDYYGTDEVAEPQPVQLTAQQSDSVGQIRSRIREHKFEAFLLFGVTGSGKTQIYIEAIHEVLAQGRSAIVLVPEISLTPQTVRRFRAHFRERVAVLHSAMSQGERYDSWRLLREGKASVAIGPRSAVFAPVQNLGLIVVDEEHEASYKQADSPRYHARDLAVVRAKMAQAVVVLGSATPSAESFHNARTGKYRLLQLDKRVYDAPLPQVELVDMVKERRLSGTREELVFSRVLRQKIRDRLEKKQQIILLLNRRGFSSFIKCKDCGYIAECENCNITLTYHRHRHRLRCHYCGYTRPAPECCPECSGADIVFRGFGTQKVEEELAAQFPGARVVRMDLDTTSQKRSHDRILRDFGRRRYDILLGTQMVAKGLDFERVTLVGVINADIGLLLPDFRSSERTFQLLTQVAGRAGRRDLPGEVIIQTYSQDSACLQCARTHDFLRFFAGEIGERRALLYPPFGRLVAIFLRGKNEARVRQAAEQYAALLRKRQNGFLVLGPSPSPIARVQKYHRWQILLKGDKRKDRSGATMRQSVQEADTLFREKFKSRGVQVAIDVDPVSLM
ncbi:MAG: primosomal protein N' [Calditrichaeota bacterium]|nr:MAG: primosomal protein N' [Calditrichota bacterium]